MELIQTALSASANLELRRIHVREEGNSVILEGTVSRFYVKQLAQEVVRAVGKDFLKNKLFLNKIQVK